MVTFVELGAYRFVTTWHGEETNDFTILVAEPGWKPDFGLQTLTFVG